MHFQRQRQHHFESQHLLREYELIRIAEVFSSLSAPDDKFRELHQFHVRVCMHLTSC